MGSMLFDDSVAGEDAVGVDSLGEFCAGREPPVAMRLIIARQAQRHETSLDCDREG
jgi:hypothetical protein